MEFKIPTSIRVEHEKLHEDLAKAIQVTGKLGAAAKDVAAILVPHFRKEEEYALPPLGLLSVLAEREIKSDMKEVLPITERFKADLPHMLEEHKAIVAALKDFIEEAKTAKKPEFVYFAEKLTLHAKHEEEVLYPAALLVGEYIKLRSIE
jgi:hypothetical protein